MKNNNLISTTGFTLIEMLVVVMIIGLLSSVVLVGLGDIRKGVRDTRRVADLRHIQIGLESYHARMGSYPVNAYGEIEGLPHDPLTSINPYTEEVISFPYGYRVSENRQNYVLGACLESKRSGGLVHVNDTELVMENFGSCKCFGNSPPEKDDLVLCLGP